MSQRDRTEQHSPTIVWFWQNSTMNSQPSTIHQATPYEQIGGAAAVRRLVTDFYDEMESHPAATQLRRMHAADLNPMRDTLFEFLCGWLGGPRTYFERTNAKCLMSAHAGFAIDKSVADQWLLCMRHALDKLDAPPESRQFIDAAFTRVCAAMINRQ